MPGISDHDIVYAELELFPSRTLQKPREIPLYKKAKWDNLRTDVKDIRTKTYGERRLAWAATSLWNDLPNDIKSSKSLAIFKKRV